MLQGHRTTRHINVKSLNCSDITRNHCREIVSEVRVFYIKHLQET